MAPIQQIDYAQMELERLASSQAELKKELQTRVQSAEVYGGVRHAVLQLVIEGSYKEAEEAVFDYLASRSQYRNFQPRCKHYAEYCKNLIRAIQSKRKFPGLKALSFSKQQEIHDAVLKHFDELKSYLTQMELVEREIRLGDLKSTTWFIRTAVYCVMALWGMAFFFDLTGGMASSFVMVVDQLLTDAITWFFNLI